MILVTSGLLVLCFIASVVDMYSRYMMKRMAKRGEDGLATELTKVRLLDPAVEEN